MKKKLISLLFLFSMLIGIIVFALPVGATTGNAIIQKNDIPLKIWFDEPAPLLASEHKPDAPNGGTDVDESWEKWSLPIGNGYFGANVFGRTETERIQISEKTLVNPHTLKNGGTTYTVGGTNSFSETFIDFGHDSSAVTNYSRYLDLSDAISGVQYKYNGVTYTREYFVSYPDRAIVIRLDADTSGALSFTLRPTIPYEQSYAAFAGDGVTKSGTVTSAVNNGVGEIELTGNMGYYGIDFLGIYKVYTDGGTVTAATAQHSYRDTDGTTVTDTDGTIVVNGAKSAYIVVTLGTDYELSDDVFTSDETNKPTKNTTLADTRVKVEGDMNAIDSKISGKSFDAAYKLIKDSHLADYKNLFDRVTIDLGAKESDFALTTDKLLENYKKGTESAYLETLLFQYGRYLLISSSRDGSLPANLQGVWNTYNMPAWACDYTHNINVEMNYWPAFSTNLAETFEAYVDYNTAYMEMAELYADALINQINPDAYGDDSGNGWVLGDHTTVYKYTSHKSAGNLGFMTQVFWEWYAYTMDPAVLEYVYDVLVNAARYITKCVVLDENGNYLIKDCDSPEMFVNGIWYYTDGTTYAQSFAYLNNYNALEAAKALGINLADSSLLSTEEYSILKTVMEQIDKYDPIHVGLSGQIKEFREEDYYCSVGDEYNHRHTSQLVGLYPGNLINSTTPAWLDAAIVTLNERGDYGSGWGVAFKMNHWARTKNGDRAHDLLESLLKNYTAENLWTMHPPFQIDANFGATAGISEMLLQSHEGYISPLAALPSSWATGSYTGLVARGNFEVSAAWENGLAKTFNITSKSGGTASVYYPSVTGAYVTDSDGNSVKYTVSGKDLISFETEVGKTYIIYGFTSVKAPDAPKKLDFTKNSNGSYSLNWSSVSGASSYNVYVAHESDPDYTLLGSVSGTTFTYVPDTENKDARMTFAVTAVSEGESKRALAYNNDDLKTEYGNVPKEYVGLPYAVFAKKANDTGYTYVESFDKFLNAANKANSLLLANSGSYRGGTAVIYMLRDSQASGDSYNNACQIDGTLIVDLGGNQLRCGVNRLIGLEAKAISGTISNVSRFEIKNGTLLTLSKPIAEFYSGSGFKYEGVKKCEILFENLTFSNGIQKTLTDPVSILKTRGEFTSTKKGELKAEFKNCTFDYKDASKTVNLIDLSAGENAICDITVTGGTLKASNLSLVNLYKSVGKDTITYLANEDGEMLKYELGSGTPPLVTPYGSIPVADMTSDKHFAMFVKGPNDTSYTYKQTFGSFLAGAMNNARDMVKRGSGTYAGGTVVIYMFKDYTYQANGSDNGSFNRAFMIDGTMIIDLGGNTITGKRARLVGFETGSSDIIGGTDYESNLILKNGTILSSNPAVEVFKGSSAYSGTKGCEIEFDGITFKTTATDVYAVKVRGDFSATQRVECKITFNDCVFDYAAQNSATMFEDSTPSGYADCDVTLSGCIFKISNFDKLNISKTSDSADSLTFVKSDNGYASVELSKDAAAPNVKFNDGRLEFVKTADGNTVTYALAPVGLSSYIPKMSITLDSSLIMNVYVPADRTISFTLDGTAYTDLGAITDKLVTLKSGDRYYHLQILLPASEAARTVTMTAEVSCTDSVANGTFSFSVQKYAEKITVEEGSVEKTLIKDVLSYVRAAYDYFGTNDSEAINKINTLLGNGYDEAFALTEEGSKTPPTKGLESVTFSVNSTPTIKFRLADGMDPSRYAFYIGDKKLVAVADADGTYIEMDVYAYEMCETVTYTIDGDFAGSYHIAAYREWSKAQNDSKLLTLVERFWRYCQSARIYKNSVEVEINYVDENGTKLAKAVALRVEKGKEFKLLSPAVDGYYTRYIYFTATANKETSFNVVYKRIPANLNDEAVKEYISDIVAWGDSITAGIGQNELTAANTYGINLEALGSVSGGTNYTAVLKNLISANVWGGIDVANCGVGGETTASIAARADTETYYLYLDGAVTVAPGASVTIPLTHYASCDRVGVLRQGGAPTVNPVTIIGKDANGKEISVTGTIAKATLTNDAPAGSSTHTCDAKYLKYTFTRTDNGTETVSFVSGARVIAHSSYTYDGRTCIIFMGENGGYSDVDELIKQQEEILKACGNPEYYLIISTTSGSNESRKALNGALTERWGNRYINMGNELNSSTKAYELAGYSDAVITSIRENIQSGTVSTLLIKDNCHPNAVGYAVIGNIIFERLFDIGAFDGIFDYYDFQEDHS